MNWETKHVTHFIAKHALLWSRTEPTISSRYACIGDIKLLALVRSLKFSFNSDHLGVFFLSYRPKHFTCIISFNSAVQWDPLFLFLFYKFGNWDLERPPSTKLLNCEAKIWTLTSDTKHCALKHYSVILRLVS